MAKAYITPLIVEISFVSIVGSSFSEIMIVDGYMVEFVTRMWGMDDRGCNQA